MGCADLSAAGQVEGGDGVVAVAWNLRRWWLACEDMATRRWRRRNSTGWLVWARTGLLGGVVSDAKGAEVAAVMR
jgi:hypothetical protein